MLLHSKEKPKKTAIKILLQFPVFSQYQIRIHNMLSVKEPLMTAVII